MARTKREWTAKLARLMPVSWGSFAKDRELWTGEHAKAGEDMVRLVRLAVELDQDPGRRAELRMTPEEARHLGERLISQADMVSEMNTRDADRKRFRSLIK